MQENKHWLELLQDAKKLRQEDNQEEAYTILRGLYEINAIRYNKDIHSSYEDYIEQKVNFFVELAQVSMIVTDKPAMSIPYLDEALIMLDSEESIRPYINVEDIKRLRKDYKLLAN